MKAGVTERLRSNPGSGKAFGKLSLAPGHALHPSKAGKLPGEVGAATPHL